MAWKCIANPQMFIEESVVVECKRKKCPHLREVNANERKKEKNVSEDALAKAIRFSPINLVDLFRIEYDDELFYYYLYDDKKKETWGTVIDKASAQTMIDILQCFINGTEYIDLSRLDNFVPMYG